MPTMIQGIPGPQNVSTATIKRLLGIAVNWYPNRNPLFTRLPKVPEGAAQFDMIGHVYRPRSVQINGAIADGVDTTITLDDASSLMEGDVLKCPSGEYIELTADPANTTDIVVRRGIASTTAAAIADDAVLVLVGNSRRGNEDFPGAVTSTPTVATQYMQTFLHPYAIGGGVQSNTTYALDGGRRTPLDQYRMDAMQNLMDDIDQSAILGKPESGAQSGSRPKMAGVRHLCATNNVTNASDKAAYKSTSFQRDLLTSARKRGGEPDVIFVASNWMDAFATWGHPLERYTVDTTKFGIDVSAFRAPFLGDVTIIEHSLLPDFTAFSLTSSEARFRVKRDVQDEEYGKTGDNMKGHIVAECAIELDNEAHHAWLEGVTAFSA